MGGTWVCMYVSLCVHVWLESSMKETGTVTHLEKYKVYCLKVESIWDECGIKYILER